MKKILYFTLITSTFTMLKAQTGIGTTTPVNKFQVETTAAAPLTTGINSNGNIRLGATSANQVLDMGLGSTYAWFQSRDKTSYATNYILALNPNGGNVGIGTISPTAKLNIVGGGIRIHNGFNNSASRPAINTGTVGNYEIRGVGSGGAGSSQSDTSDDGFLRLSAGGGTNANSQSLIEISGYSNTADMNNTIVMKTSGTERLRIDNNGATSLTGNLTGNGSTSTLSNFSAAINDQTTSYTLTNADNGKVITFNSSSAVTVTVPSLSIGFNCMILQKGAGQVTISPSSVTINNRYGFTKTAGQYSVLNLVCIASGVYVSSGDMTN
jgi:hypothetical protein